MRGMLRSCLGHAGYVLPPKAASTSLPHNGNVAIMFGTCRGCGLGHCRPAMTGLQNSVVIVSVHVDMRYKKGGRDAHLVFNLETCND